MDCKKRPLDQRRLLQYCVVKGFTRKALVVIRVGVHSTESFKDLLEFRILVGSKESCMRACATATLIAKH